MNHPTTNPKTDREKYYEHIDTICDVVENRANERDQIAELVWNEVDSSEYIIYYSKNLDVLQISDNEPEEFQHLIDDDSSWREVIQMMAYKVMEQDVYDQLRARNLI